MSSRIPDKVTFEWFQQNRNGLVRNLMRYADQHKAAAIIGPNGQIAPGKYSHTSKNVIYDLRELETAAVPDPITPPVLSLTVDDPNQELDLTWTLPQSYDELLLEKSEDQVTWEVLASMGGTVAAYDDGAVTVGVTEYYRIRARVGGAYSAYSNIVNGVLAAAGLALFGAGSNAQNQLGDGSTTEPDDLTAIGIVTTWTKVAAGLTHSVAVRSDGTLWSCGFNQYGQCGDGSSGNTITSWTQVGTDTDWADVSAGERHSMAVKSNGAVYTFGRNNLGQLGVGDNSNRLSPTQIGSGSTWIHAIASEFNVLLVKDDNTLWMAGWGTQSQIGDGASSNRNALTQTSGTGYLRAYAGRDSSYGIKTDGTLWAWGSNTYGKLGLNSLTDPIASPTQVGTDTDWKSVSGGESFAIATKTGGTIWVAGEELSGGELGLGATADTGLVFVQIGSDTNWDYTSSGPSSTMALKTTGAVYGWGYNGDGGLGVGDLTDRNIPTQESSTSTAWQFVANACGYHSFALQPP